MRMICLNCGNEFDGKVYFDELGTHGNCPVCESSFDVELNIKEQKRLELDGKSIEPTNKKGLEDYHFLTLCGTIFVYHYIEYKKPLGGMTKNWLCCTEGWNKRADGKWYETIPRTYYRIFFTIGLIILKFLLTA